MSITGITHPVYAVHWSDEHHAYQATRSDQPNRIITAPSMTEALQLIEHTRSASHAQ